MFPKLTVLIYVLCSKETIVMLWSTELVLETLNSSVNVIIYAIFNKKFRMLFAEMFCCSYFKIQENSTQDSRKFGFKTEMNVITPS